MGASLDAIASMPFDLPLLIGSARLPSIRAGLGFAMVGSRSGSWAPQASFALGGSCSPSVPGESGPVVVPTNRAGSGFSPVGRPATMECLRTVPVQFFRSTLLPAAIVVLFGLALFAVSARIWLPGDMAAPAPMG